MARRRRLAWDSTCFLAYLDRKDTEARDVLQAVDVTFERMIKGTTAIIASQAIETEVRPGNVAETQSFHIQLKACRFFESFPESPAIRKLARDLQDRLQISGRKGQYADLIHVATAIASGAEEFWTTDEKVLRWHTEGVIPEIKICRPYLEQGVLDL